MGKIAAALIAFWIAGAASAMAISWATHHNRAAEWPQNERSPISKEQVGWATAHIRDDLGGICILLGITNGLLAAILVALLM